MLVKVLVERTEWVGLGKWQPDILIGTATHKANSECPFGPVLAWTLMIDNSINQHLCLIHRDHVHRVIGQTHVVSIQLIDMHIVL